MQFVVVVFNKYIRANYKKKLTNIVSHTSIYVYLLSVEQK